MAVGEIEAAGAAGSNENVKMSNKRERSFGPLPFFILGSASVLWKEQTRKLGKPAYFFKQKAPARVTDKGLKPNCCGGSILSLFYSSYPDSSDSPRA
jgi:hypothetical protein